MHHQTAEHRIIDRVSVCLHLKEWGS